MSDFCNGMNSVLKELGPLLGLPCFRTMSATKRQIQRLKDTLADAIVRPMGVVPDAAYDFITAEDLARAQERYEKRDGKPS